MKIRERLSRFVSGVLGFGCASVALEAHASDIVVYNPTDEPQEVSFSVFSGPSMLTWLDPSQDPPHDAVEGSAWMYTGDDCSMQDTCWVKVEDRESVFPDGWSMLSSASGGEPPPPEPRIVQCQYCDTHADLNDGFECRACGAPLPAS